MNYFVAYKNLRTNKRFYICICIVYTINMKYEIQLMYVNKFKYMYINQ